MPEEEEVRKKKEDKEIWGEKRESGAKRVNEWMNEIMNEKWAGSAAPERDCWIMWVHCLGWKLPGRLDGLFIESWRDGLGEEMEWEQERKIALVFHFIVFFHQRREERRIGKRRCLKWGFLDLTWLVNSTEVSALATGPNQDQALFLNIHPGPGQTDGSGIQLFKWRQGRVGIKSRAGWMDDWHRGIFYCKSLIIEDGVICCPLITLTTTLVLLSQMKLSVSLLHERWKDAVADVMLSDL